MDSAKKILGTHWPQFSDVRWMTVANRNRFSEARLWRVSTTGGDYCLRQWPAEVDCQHLREIHRLLEYAATEAIDFLPRPIVGAFSGKGNTEAGNTEAGEGTLFREYGHWWELTTWMPGAPTFAHQPSEVKLRAALRALALFHQTLANVPAGQPSVAGSEIAGDSWGTSPGLQHRAARLHALLSGKAADWYRQIPGVWPQFTSLALRILEHFHRLAPRVQSQLQPLTDRTWVLQPCLRDIWHQHVLFSGSRVTGIVDFGAMARDHVAIDVARLTGSMIEDDPRGWEIALEAYTTDRPLSLDERQLVQVFDRANVVLSGMQWIEWICVQRRTFRDGEGVLRRCRHFLRRLDGLQQNLAKNA